MRHGLLLLMTGLGQGASQVVDVTGQVPQFTVVDYGQWGIEVALLDGFYRVSHIGYGFGQAQCQAAGQ
ncbi:hypothetical protein D3C77_455290 [compost metagenome]